MRPVKLEPVARGVSCEAIRQHDRIVDRLEDASAAPPGSCERLYLPEDERQASLCLAALHREGHPVLFQAARTSLTGGAIPHGEAIVSIERMNSIGPINENGDEATVRVGPGVRLRDLQRTLAARGWQYPPTPTYLEAMVGGVVSTNAGGPASFRYGVTRDWVLGLHVVTADGRRLEVERGQFVASTGESFPWEGTVRLPRPEHRLPSLKKITAGYHSAPQLDLVDLFVGAEGTLGLITEATLRLQRLPAGRIGGWVFLADDRTALAATGELRCLPVTAALSIRSVEFIDRDCLRLLREDGIDRKLRIELPAETGAAIYVVAETDRSWTDTELMDLLTDGTDVGQFLQLLVRYGDLDNVYLATDADPGRFEELVALRESVPHAVFERVRRTRLEVPEVQKLGGDTIVPFERLNEFMVGCREALARHEVVGAIWGHVSDGNLHPNVIAQSADEMKRGADFQLE
ncbi:MAG: FAD-binding oxidoreductase, partial [Acidobacteriota bacterium]|nr:FAD-binding oxidoreductase [Acidobacteriota bacterium]